MKILKGEAVLIKTNKNIEERLSFVNDNFENNADVFVINSKNISVDEIRNFQEYFQKESHGLNKDFKRLGIIIFDDISIQAQNALLKILEDIDKGNCIILYTNKNVKFLSTILSRVIKIDDEDSTKKNKIKEPDLTSKEDIDKQEVVKWIEYKIENSKNKDKIPLIWINSPSPNIKYIIEYVNLFY